MKIAAEFITALPHAERREITVLMSGYRIDFSVDEACALVQAVSGALHTMQGDFNRPPPAPAPRQPDQAAIIAQVEDQVISWAQITASLESHKR
jgi:hypothetical protein